MVRRRHRCALSAAAVLAGLIPAVQLIEAPSARAANCTLWPQLCVVLNAPTDGNPPSSPTEGAPAKKHVISYHRGTPSPYGWQRQWDYVDLDPNGMPQGGACTPPGAPAGWAPPPGQVAVDYQDFMYDKATGAIVSVGPNQCYVGPWPPPGGIQTPTAPPFPPSPPTEDE